MLKKMSQLALLEVLAQSASGHPRVCTTPVPHSGRQEGHKKISKIKVNLFKNLNTLVDSPHRVTQPSTLRNCCANECLSLPREQKNDCTDKHTVAQKVMGVYTVHPVKHEG